MKKISLFLLSLLMIVSSLPCVTYAVETYTYELNNGALISYFIDNDEITITKYDDTNAVSNEVEIPNEIDGIEVTTIKNGSFKGNENITKIVIPSNISTIESYAFRSCINLSEYIFETEQCNISGTAFDHYKITNNGSNVETIKNDIKLTYPITLNASQLGGIISFSNSVSLHIKAGSTGECPTDIACWNNGYNSTLGVIEVVLDEGIKTLGDNYFRGISFNCENIILPSTLERIGDSCFYGWNNLTNIIIPENVKRIGDWAFFDCKKLSEITLPSHIEYVGIDALCTNCPNGTLIKCVVPNDYYYYVHSSKALKQMLDESTLFVNTSEFQQRSFPLSSAMQSKTVVLGENISSGLSTSDFWRFLFSSPSGISFDRPDTFVLLSRKYTYNNSKYLNNFRNTTIWGFDADIQEQYRDYLEQLYLQIMEYNSCSREEAMNLCATEYFGFNSYADFVKNMGDDIVDPYTVTEKKNRKWLKEVYLEANGGEFDNGETENYTVYLDGEEFDGAVVPYRYGYNFLGWSILPDSEEVIEDNFTINHNYHFYAVWELKDASVVVNYIDTNGEKLADSETINGKVFDEYITSSKEFEYYELIEVPVNASGTMTEDVISVDYVYRLKDASVVINYVDTDGNPLAESEVIDGKIFEEYNAEAKDIEHYNLTATPDNATGTMTEKTITVDFVYELKNASVLVKYVDTDGNELTESNLIEGKVFDEYSTGAKHIEGYELTAIPDNAEGTMAEEAIFVEYVYERVVEPEKPVIQPTAPSNEPTTQPSIVEKVEPNETVVNTGDNINVFYILGIVALILSIICYCLSRRIEKYEIR